MTGADQGRLLVTDNETGTADAAVVDALSVRLLAERAGNGSGRVYTITIPSTAASGHSATTLVKVTTPRH